MSTTIRPSDQAKLAVLVGGLLLVIGFIVWQVRASSVGGPPAPDTAPATISLSSSAKVPVVTESGLIEIPAISTPPDMEPFRTVLMEPAPSNPQATKSSQRIRPPHPISSPIGGTTPFLPKIDSVAGASESMTDLGLYVEGVIVGGEGVAVIHFGPETHVVRQGDRFGDDMKIQSISETRVVISKGKERITLSVGKPPSP